MDKQTILDEIRRTAEQNGDMPLGMGRFYTETGIRIADWSGKYWARWSDALLEAGYAPNTLSQAYEDKVLIESLIALARELGRYPGDRELRLKRRMDPSFPAAGGDSAPFWFETRYG